MILIRLASFGLAAAVVAILPAVPAQAALLTRTFVSAAGSDSNPCTIGQPCATFAHAYTLTAANGIIAALDPGKYGPLTITQPVTVNGNGWAAITGPIGGDAITVDTGSGSVALIGLEIDGAAASNHGIVFNSGSLLTVTNCTVQNFTFDGILLEPTSGAITFVITDTIVAHNSSVGIYYLPPSGTATANGLLDHVTVTSNNDGIDIVTTNGGGAATVAIADSISGNNNGDGIFINNGSAAMTVSIDNANVFGNSFEGIFAGPTPTVYLGRSVITQNFTFGILNGTSPNTFNSYGDNRIDGNGTDVSGPALNMLALH